MAIPDYQSLMLPLLRFRFKRQFLLGKEELEAVNWTLPLEHGDTMFQVVNIYTKAAQYRDFPAGSYKLQKVGGTILGMAT